MSTPRTATTLGRVTFSVHGTPQPKGSLKAFHAYRSRRVVVTADNPKLAGWQRTIRAEALGARRRQCFAGPVEVTCVFILPRPLSYPKRVVAHTRKPDLDKLVRAVLDALAAGVLFGDDAAVVSLRASKSYVAPGFGPGVTITVADATDQVPEGTIHDREPDPLSANRG